MMFHNFIHPTKKTHRLITTVLIFFFIIGSGTYHAEEANDAKPSETYEKLKILTEVLYLIITNYVEEVDVTSIIYSGIHEMMRTIDPHGSFMPPELYEEMHVETRGNYAAIGIQIAIKNGQPTVIDPIFGTPAYYAGIQAGDRLIKIDKQFTKNMPLMEVVKLLRGPKGSHITVTIMRDGFDKPKDFTMIRDIVELRSVIARMLNNKIGYIQLNQFQEDSADEIEDDLNELEQQGMKALILDLRGNSGGLLNACIEVADKFLDKGKLIAYTEGRKKNQNMRFLAHQDLTHPNYPMVVLVNHGSARGAEITIAALQAHKRALILGTPTDGTTTTIQSVIPLSDGSGLKLTTGKFYAPLKEPDIQGKGIIPDIIMEQPESETPIKFGDLNSDTQLQRAFSILTFQMVY